MTDAKTDAKTDETTDATTDAKTDATTLRPASPSAHRNPATDVYAVYGVEPEVLAYAMAKYSRSALTMKESLAELSQQKAEKFLDTFYFAYGHRSIADLAHIALAVERLSMLAAIVLVDETRWDGQERSTRYQDFRKSGWYTPDFALTARDASEAGAAQQLYTETIAALYAAYESLGESAFQYLRAKTPKPEEMKLEAYERTLRARAFDVSRYLLPLAANTSLGEIVNARTLENQVSHLLSHTHAEVRGLGAKLKAAALEPAHNTYTEKYRDLVLQISAHSEMLAKHAEDLLLRPVRVAPTLVKYAIPNPYEIATRAELRQAAAELMGGAAIEPAERVELLDDDPLEIDLATTLLYEHCHYPYRQIRAAVEAAGAARRDEIVALGTKHRGSHDELLRAFQCGQRFRFDILMDIGGFRDMHRHRRCVQIMQGFTTLHGYEEPEEVAAAGAGVAHAYHATMQRVADAYAKLVAMAGTAGTASEAESWEANAQYVIPLGFRKRTLFKMDFAEALYISELRSGPAGHISYRRVAYAMYEAVAKKYPGLANYFRVTDVNQPVDLLKR